MQGYIFTYTSQLQRTTIREMTAEDFQKLELFVGESVEKGMTYDFELTGSWDVSSGTWVLCQILS